MQMQQHHEFAQGTTVDLLAYKPQDKEVHIIDTWQRITRTRLPGKNGVDSGSEDLSCTAVHFLAVVGPAQGDRCNDH